MKYHLTLPLAILAFAFPLVAQQPAASDETIKITTQLIQIDATVTDKQGRIVSNLKPEDFEVYENGRKQKLTNFSFVEVGATTPAAAVNQSPSAAVKSSSSVAVPSVPRPPTQTKRTYALVVDDLGLSFESMKAVREALLKFVDQQMQDGDLVAIVRTGGSSGARQSFTTDKRILRAEIEKLRWSLRSRSGVDALDPVTVTMAEQLRGNVDRDGNIRAVEGAAGERQFLDNVNEFRSRNFAVGTLGALDNFLRGMARLPGRKAMIVFSEGFKLNQRSSMDFAAQNEIYEYLRVIADVANRSAVVIYALDPRGLLNPGMLMAADETDGSFGTFGPGGDLISLTREARAQGFLESQRTLEFLSYSTGGIPYTDQNRLDVGLGRALNDQRGYYLLGYEPENESFDPKKARYNKLQVKLRDKNLRVRYRSGFFGVENVKPDKTLEPTKQTIIDAIVSPFTSTDVGLSLYPIFTNSAADGDVIHALLYIDVRDLDFKEAENGKRRSVFDMTTMTFGTNGAVVNQVWQTYTIELPEAVYQYALEKGFVYDFYVPVKSTGAHQLRVVLRDSTSGKLGSASQYIEIPDASKQRVTVSNIVLDNYSAADWERIRRGESGENGGRSAYLDTTQRRFKRGSVLRYGCVIYRTASAPDEKPNLAITTRLIKDGKIVVESGPTPFDASGEKDQQRLETGGVMTLGRNLEPGNYILQIIALDQNGKPKQNVSSQWVDFEVE